MRISIILILFIFSTVPCQSALIECTTTASCHRQIITCPQNEDCIIDCNGDATCSFSTITCPHNDSNTCSVTCNENLSCTHATIQAHHSSSLSITSNGYESLSFSHVYCPDNALLDGACNITYDGYQNGFSMMNIYTTHNYNAIHLTCASILGCWSTQSNPTLHYGDSTYSQTCTVINANQCQLDDVLIALPDTDHSILPSTTTTIAPLPSITVTDTIADDIVSNELDHQPHTNGYSWGITLMLVVIGILIGCIVSMCCAFIYVFLQSRGHNIFPRKPSTPRQPHKINIDDIPSPKRMISKRSLSPSLRDLSPELKPTDMELVAVDFLQNAEINDINRMISASYENTQMRAHPSMGDEGDGDVIVTVERYANSDNKCDESGVHSPMSSTWLSFKDHVRSDTAMTLSVCLEKQTNGIAPDEFVVRGSDETPA